MRVIDSLQQLHGIGEKGADVLIKHFGSEEEAVLELQNFRLGKFLKAPLTQQTKVEIVKNIFAKKHGYSYTNIFKTPESKEVYSRILTLLKQHASTHYARYLLTQFYPVDNVQEIHRRHALIAGCIEQLAPLGTDEIKDVQKHIQTLETTASTQSLRQNSVCIATEDDDLFKELKIKLPKGVPLLFIQSETDVDRLREYECARYLDSIDAKYTVIAEQFESVVCVPRSAPLHEAVPELVLNYFVENKEKITAAVLILDMLAQRGITLIEEHAQMNALLNHITPLTEDGLSQNTPTLSADELRALVHTSHAQLTATVAEQMSQTHVSGAELMAALSKGDGSLPAGMQDVVQSAIKQGELALAHHCGLPASEFTGLFTRTLPIAIDDDHLLELTTRCNAAHTQSKFTAEKQLASTLHTLIPLCEVMFERMLDLDVECALARFVREFSLSVPTLVGGGFSFRDGRNLFLCHEHGANTITPVNYHLGKEHTTTVITGANSGGKTTLLQLIAQHYIMASMGLYVPSAQCEIGLVDEVFFFGKNRGNTDAGAFETLLRSFATITNDGKKRLILADEIEAVTEPGAAAKIITSLLKYFTNENTMIALVTHLGTDIAHHAQHFARIDGIEAQGLDEDLNLIVNRNPKIGYLATSTPELIIERLAKKEGNQLFDFIHKEM